VSELERMMASAEALAHFGSWSTDLHTRETLWSEGLCRIVGVPLDTRHPEPEQVFEFSHPDDRERFSKAMLLAMEHPESVPAEGLAFETRAVRTDGTVIELQAIGRIEHEGGRPVRWVGCIQDVTDERLTERELLAHYALTQALRDWETFEEGVVDLLRRLGTALAYPMSSLWFWDSAEGMLACRSFWTAPDFDPGSFATEKRRLRFAPGEGAPGAVWQTEQPAVTADIALDPAFRPRDAALAAGLRSAITVPVLASDGPIAILCFYDVERRAPSPRLLRTLTGIGQELGHFLERRRAQLEPQRLTPRELEVLELSATGLTGPGIAERLVISPSTVKTHFENLYEKLGVSDRAAAVAEALRSGLIT
jgi:PAS domain S-box-containing protein